MNVYIVATLKPKPEYYQDVKKILESLLIDSRNEIGNIRYDLFLDSKDKNNFYLIEVYEDEDAFEKHRNSHHYLTYRKEVESLLSEMPEVKIISPINVKLY